MFAHISLIASLLIFSPALPNGIRLTELPAEGDSFEILAGYANGISGGLPSTEASRSLILAAYGAGGEIEFFNELDRAGFRLNVPRWAAPMFTDPLVAFFKDVPEPDATPTPANPDFRAKVEGEIRAALIESRQVPADYSTDTAFVLMTGPIPEALRESLAAIPRREAVKNEREAPINRLPAERTLRFKPDLPAGAVIFASPIPTVYYKEWYSVLLLDRLIHRIVHLPVSTALPLTLHPYYYRLELAVPAGQFPESVEENLLQEIQRLQFTRADPKDLEAARQDARGDLESKYAREWFESHGIPERREEGIQWLEAMTADDMRVAARDLLIMNRVIASWAPKVKETAVEVESLSGGAGEARPSPALSARPLPGGEAGTLNIAAFPQHQHPAQASPLPERLTSGVSLVEGNIHAVFVAGGALIRFEREPGADTLKVFQTYRADRLLVMAPQAAMDRARQLWSSFKGSSSPQASVPKGKVSAGDLPALFILKVMLDRKIIEAGWWSDVELRISASEGSALQIDADSERRARVIEWIKRIASDKPSDPEFAWAQEVAIHRFETIRADLQALTWERDPQGAIQDPGTVAAGHILDVARIYF